MNGSRFALVTVIGALILGAGTGAILGKKGPDPGETAVAERTAILTRTALSWYPTDPEPDTFVYAGIERMLEQLDPHSNFLEPKVFRKMRERQEGSFFGVGIIISRRAGKVTVIAPIAGTPAARKGVRAGDVIAAVDGDSTEEMTLDEFVDRVRGPEGTTVHLTIQRPGFDEPLELDIERARIPTNSVRYAFMITPDTGYILLSEFSNTSPSEIDSALARLESQGMKRLLLDLRDDPGGALEAAIEVADRFLEKGMLIVSTKGRAPGNDNEYRAPGGGVRYHGPLTILVNTGSASASEIVAGAVQDHDRGLLVGEPTWGKGLVQTVYTIRDAGLALTTARYYTPSGRCIQRDYDSFIDYMMHRNGEGEAGPVYHTETGRPVRGGGGIHPDVTVEARKLSEQVAVLYGQSAFFRFAIELLKDVPEAEKKPFAERFEADDLVIARFRRFVLGQEILDETAWTKLAEDAQAMDDVRRAIRVEVLNSGVGLEAGYREAITGDNQVAEALAHAAEADRLWTAWTERHGGS